MAGERHIPPRLAVLAVAVLLGAAAIALRLVTLQLFDAESYRARAREQHESQVRVEGRRGTLWDRNGRELAVSVETKSVYVHPYQIRTAGEKERIVGGVAAALGASPSEIREIIDRPKNRKFAFLRRRLTPRETSALESLHLPAIGWMTDSQRFYPRGVLAAHALGFVDIDGKGQAGVERGYDKTVRGEPTTFISLVDARQRPLLLRTNTSGRSGHDVTLTIDETIQYLADAEIDRAMEETGAKGGTIIVMDPQSGEILALANRPGFDPNRPGAAAARSRENLAVSYGYEPGSTFKVITAAAALEENRARPTDLFDCGNGSITIFGRRIGDVHAHATLSFAQIVAKSSNVGIIRIGQRLSPSTFCGYVERFGFGRKTGVDLPNEAPGVVQSPGGRTWSGLSQPTMAMGHSIVVTPLQMLTAISAIGAGGRRFTPHIVRSIMTSEGRQVDAETPDPVRVVSEKTARTLCRILETVVDDGTGGAAAIPGYRVAGKTGTAQKVVGGVYSHTAHVSSFVGFVPSLSPALAAIVVLDEPVGKYYGGDVAAPTFARVVGPALAYLRVPSTEPIPPPKVSPAALRARAVAEKGKREAARRRAENLRAWMLAHPEEPPPPPPRPFPARWPSPSAPALGVVPDVYGMSLRTALGLLAKSGCRPRITGSGFVIEQTPQAGTPIALAGAYAGAPSSASPAEAAGAGLRPPREGAATLLASASTITETRTPTPDSPSFDCSLVLATTAPPPDGGARPGL